MSINIFEQASRKRLRFESGKGLLTVEDLWELPLTSATGKANLDDIARGLHQQLEKQPRVSFVKNTASEPDADVQLAFDLVLHIINVRVTENEVAASARARAEQKQRLMALIKQKEDEQLAGSSLEELRELINQLEG